jgi:hypothetical protein
MHIMARKNFADLDTLFSFLCMTRATLWPNFNGAGSNLIQLASATYR